MNSLQVSEPEPVRAGQGVVPGRDLTRFEALALALSMDKPAALEAYARAELRRLWGQPSTCWQCKADVDERDETCPACSADLMPF